MVNSEAQRNGPRVSSAKGYRQGTHRLCDPEVTLARVKPLLPVMGITRIANVTGLDHVGIPVVMVTRPNSRSLAVSQGKGHSLAAAKASGVMESIEGYHAEHITRPLKLNSYEELRYTHPLVEAETLPLIEGSRFDPDFRTLWIEGLDLLGEGEAIWLPYEMVHTDYRLPLPSGSGCFPLSSNGLASGNDWHEAVCHGLCEVIERDALTLWEQRPEAERATTRLDPASIDDPDCEALLGQLAAAGLAVGLWNITSDIEVPAFLCRILDRQVAPDHAIGTAAGSGCHPAREIALSRAITEAAQSRLTQIAGSRDDLSPNDYQASSEATRTRQLESWGRDAGPCRFDELATWNSDRFDADLSWILARLEGPLTRLFDRLDQLGIEPYPPKREPKARALVVDLARPEFGLAVVRVVVPGLEDGVDQPAYSPGPRAIAALRDRP